MLNQPINVIPSVLSGVGEGVIDATLPLTVSWRVSGDSPMVAYKIKIYQNDTASTLLYTGSKVTLSTPFYGNDKNGVQQTFTANSITASQLSSAGIVNGYANGYKLEITQWWGSTDAESITQTSPSVFITRKTPTLSISGLSATVTSKNISLTGTFTQDQGDTVSLVRWILGTTNDESNPIVDTGDMETAVMAFDYDGLIPPMGDEDYSYFVRLIVQTSSGVTVDTGNQEFDVDYPIYEGAAIVSACVPHGKQCVEVSWTNRSTIHAAIPNPPVSGGRVILSNSDICSYQEVYYDAPWSIVWKGSIKASDGADHVVLTATTYAPEASPQSGEFSLTLNESGVSFSLDGNIIFTSSFTIKDADDIAIAITPTHYYIRQDTWSGGTIPSTTLYPSESLYPNETIPVVNTYDGEITYTQYSFEEGYITLRGQSECEYLWMTYDEVSPAAISLILNSPTYEPVFDGNTMLLATFRANTDATVSGSEGLFTGFSLYRAEVGTNQLVHILDISERAVTSVRDYSARSRHQYIYYLYQLDENNNYSEVYTTEAITPQYQSHKLIECSYSDVDGAYHVVSEYSFKCNANQGSIANNNTPNILQNFTRYANRQPVSTLYDSGTLTALIGAITQYPAAYYDSWDLANEIKALSVNTNPKFMTDMKGAIWMVETSGAIATETGNSNQFMPIKITIPWLEVGDASGLSIVSIPTDALYIQNQIEDATLSVDLRSGHLVMNVPDGYQGTSLRLNNGHLVATTDDNITDTDLVLTTRGHLVAVD